MKGAIVGDLVGSIYEWHNIKTKDFYLLDDRCYFTDDTVCTVALASSLPSTTYFYPRRWGTGRKIA